MKPSLLASKFRITETGIELHDRHITKQDFIQAAIEYVELVSVRTFKQGDLLNKFRELFQEDLHRELISKLVVTTKTKTRTFENQMSLAKHHPAHERSDRISPGQYDALQSLQDPTERGKLIVKLIKEKDAGRNIPVQEWRKLVRAAKVRTNRPITRSGPKRKSTGT